jgi:hypothetical protein
MMMMKKMGGDPLELVTMRKKKPRKERRTLKHIVGFRNLIPLFLQLQIVG